MRDHTFGMQPLIDEVVDAYEGTALLRGAPAYARDDLASVAQVELFTLLHTPASDDPPPPDVPLRDYLVRKLGNAVSRYLDSEGNEFAGNLRSVKRYETLEAAHALAPHAVRQPLREHPVRIAGEWSDAPERFHTDPEPLDLTLYTPEEHAVTALRLEGWTLGEIAEHLATTEYVVETTIERVRHRLENESRPIRRQKKRFIAANMDEFLSRYYDAEGYCISTEELLREYIRSVECRAAQQHWSDLPRFERELRRRGYLIGRLTALDAKPLNWYRGVANLGGPESLRLSARRLVPDVYKTDYAEIETGYLVPADPPLAEKNHLARAATVEASRPLLSV